MLWGSYPARIDEKFRLKIPAKFRRDLPETEGNVYFVTSDNGKCAQIYPIPIWEQISEKLHAPPRYSKAKQKLIRNTSYYGMLAPMDPQGRILIPQNLREDAQLSGEVVVMGKHDHLEVWNNEMVRRSMQEEPLTDEDRDELAAQGV